MKCCCCCCCLPRINHARWTRTVKNFLKRWREGAVASTATDTAPAPAFTEISILKCLRDFPHSLLCYCFESLFQFPWSLFTCTFSKPFNNPNHVCRPVQSTRVRARVCTWCLRWVAPHASAHWLLGTHITEHSVAWVCVLCLLCIYNKFLLKLDNALLIYNLLYDVCVHCEQSSNCVLFPHFVRKLSYSRVFFSIFFRQCVFV